MAPGPREPVEGVSGDGPAAEALAPPRVPGHPALLLPDRSGGNSDLAHGSGTGDRQARQRRAGEAGKRQRRSQPGAVADGTEAGHWRRQDHGDGHADRLANHQRRPPSGEQPLHQGIPGGGAGAHDSRPPTGADAERHRELLQADGAGAAGSGSGAGQGPDRDHQLPRLPQTGTA